MRLIAIIMLLLAAVPCIAQEYGDAPASYGTASGWLGAVQLGATSTADSQNPITPAWSGDLDDGIVGTPYWDSWSSDNTLTVRVECSYPGYELVHVLLWVDADDSGVFDSNELYQLTPGERVVTGADYTFTGIRIHATQNFSRNGANKVGIRLMVQENFMGPAMLSPNASFYYGEVEDWLIDVEPAKFAVATEQLREATVGLGYSQDILPVNGTAPYQWSLTAGQLPAGMGLARYGDAFRLSGTPSAGAEGSYALTVQVQDGAGAAAQRTLQLEVAAPATSLPFKDTFSNNLHWKLDADWSIGQATGFASSAASARGYPSAEPGNDFTPATNDDMVLMSTPGAAEPSVRTHPSYATSPVLDCSGASSVQLKFRRYYSLATSNANTAIEISNDAATWTTVWTPPSPGWLVSDVAWSTIRVDISQWAANQSRVRLRIRLGTAAYWFAHLQDFCGWAVDDFEVRELPSAGSIAASAFDFQSPAQYQDPQNNQWYPLAYPQYTHTWQAVVDNPGAEDITLSSCEVNVTLPTPPGTAAANERDYLCAADCCHDFADWSLAQPVVVPAGATGVVVSGSCNFRGSAYSQDLMLPFRATLYLEGTRASGQPIEISAQTEFIHNYAPMSGLYIYEAQSGGTQVLNGQAASNLRDFGSVPIGGTSSWLNIVLRNTSSSAVTVGAPVLSGPDASEFSLDTSSYNSTIAPNTYTWFSVRFAPSAGGSCAATVTFTHDASNTGSPFSFGIAGLGAVNAPAIRVHEGSLSGQLVGNGSQATGMRNFGLTDLGTPSQPLQIHIENVGTQPLAMGQPALAGPDAGEFSLQSSAFTATLAPGASTNVEVVFDPSTVGVKTAWLSFTHNDPGTASPFIVNLTGEGIIAAPLIVVRETGPYGAAVPPGASPSADRTFGPIQVGTGGTGWLEIFICNDGWSALTLTAPALSGSGAADFVLDTSGMQLTVPAQSLTSFRIAFDPIAKGPKAATVSFTHNDAAVANPFTFDVAGYATDPAGVVILPAGLPRAQVAEPYATTLIAGGGTTPYTWQAVGGLPAGLALDAAGTLSGVPSGPHGVVVITVQVTDALGGTDVQQKQLIIQPPVGYMEKDGGSQGGGCASTRAGFAWLLLAIPLLFARRRRTSSRTRGREEF